MDQVSPKQSELIPSKETDHTLEVTANVADQPEEDDNIPFAKVTEELEILNKEGQTRLYTGPYGRIMSPFKKFSSFTSQRGVKRSPRKLPLPHSKRVKLKADFDLLATDSESSDSDTSPDSLTPEKVMDNPVAAAGPSLDPQPSQQGIDEETEDSDSEDDQWQIMEESETEIDKQLDEKSDKYSLSAINVKSIIHKIVTNEKVVEMVRRAVLEQVEEKKQEYEPKMTRSKAKKAMEKHEDVPHPLGLSPSKKGHDKSKFLEIDLPEDEEDDEDFNPDKIGYTHGSEDDSESVLSSSYSDCETSSLPSTPSTPVGQQTLVIKDSKTPTNTETDNSNSFLSPMGPPLQNFVPRSQHKSSSLGQKYKDAIERDEKAKREEEELIASRTRSKCPLNKVSLFDLEATFVAPDITEDMYDTTCDDKDWNDFLKTLIVFDNNNTEDTNEAGGEEEDPEFNFLEEAEHAEYDQEDFRNDRAVKVSKKELNLLIDELNEAYYEDDPIDVKSKKVIKAQTETIVVANSQKRQSEAQNNLVYDVADKEKRQIADQLRQHVQLLTQSFVLGMGDPEEHENVIDATKMFLTELKTFADKSELTCPDTLLKVCNLESALSVITDPIWQSTVELSADETDRMDGLKFRYENQELPRLNYKQMKILWTSPAFMYPELLPHGGFYKLSELKKDRSRIKFIEPEDNLLAMGLDQFSHLPNGKEYIHTFMLPCKTKKQIMIRMKNLSAKTAKNNAVKYWKDNKKLPVFSKSAPFFKPEMMKACKDRNISLAEFPSWAAFFRPEDAAQGSSVSDLRPIMMYGCQYLTADPDDKSLSILSEETNSTPDNTLQTTDSSTVASSSSSGNSISKVQAKPRPKKLTRKRLDLDKGNKRSVPAFIPLSFSGTIKSSNSNLTIISVSNNMSSDSLKLNQLFHHSVSAASIATTSINRMQSLPSTRVVDSGSSMSSAEAWTSNVSISSGNTGTSTSVSSVSADENTSVHNLRSNSNTSVVASVSGSGGSGDSSHGTTTNNDMIVSSLTNNGGSGDKVTSADVCKSTIDSMPLLIGSEDHAQRQSTSRASVSTTPGVMDRTVQRIVLSPLSNFNNNAVQTSQCTSSQTSASVSSQASPFISRNPAGVSDEDVMSTCSTPQKSSQSMSPLSDVSGTPKSALEIIASYAPYLLSPSANRDQQKVLETTPKKKSGFIKLAPKPTPPGSDPSPTVSIHVPKIQSSPKRKMLNRQAKAILPKGFIVRSFDVSPSKKAASSLVEKAKNPGRKSRSQSFYFSSPGSYCKILPQPSSAKQLKHDVSTMKSGITQTLGYIGSGRSLKKKASGSANKPCRSSNAVKAHVDDDKENAEIRIKDKTESGQNVDMEVDDDDDKAVDTESDYTQSEDGNETQEELDSQEEVDSQEDDDSHIANLMQASTTTSRFDPGKDDASKSHLGKKDRDRDTTLAMLAPDVISTDPQRDVRDTAFAQAYLHKVKKTLRDDMDSLEKFLQLMYNFSKAKESPIKLYTELKDLFQDYPGLLHDFAGFLLQEQAVECGCYDAFEEFNSARSFLRKIELHFSKTPYHFQRIIKTFSRWYRKSGRSTRDLKNEIEPMLKGHKYLLEEFSKFFPAEPPPDSMMDDFEEINLDGTDDEVKYDSFEEIELFEGEEVLGTKRCTCTCHQSKDETYRKKKKHCYRCCLTVIDGELVYRVNKSTIKKINITFGPPMKASSLLMLDTDEKENSEKMAVKALETEVGKESDTGENLIQVDREPTDTDSGCVIDSDGMEKEMVPGGCVNAGATKESDKVPSKHSSSNYMSFVTEISSSTDKGEELQVSGSLRQESDITARESIQSYTDKTTNTADSVINRSADGSVKATNDQLRLENNRKPKPDQNNEASKSEFNNSGNVTDKCESEQPKMKSKNINDNPKTVSELSNPSHSSSDTALANDILAAAFNAALTSDVSLDNVFPFPLATQYEQGKPKAVLSAGVHELFDRDATFSTDSQKLWKRSGENANLEQEPKPVTEKTITSTSAPMLQKEATIQSQSNYPSKSKVKPAGDVSVVTSDSVRQSGELDSVQVFSPFSPFGQEIQSITNAKSPAPNKVPSVSKVRRITPIPVKKGASGDDESFQSVVQNSPVITDMIQSPLSQIVLEKSTDDSNSSKVGKVTSEESNKLSSIPIPFTEFGSNSAKSSDSLSQKSVDTEMSSQKSDSSGRTVTSGNTANSSAARPLKISQPAIFSEDANVGFTGTSEYMAAHISDDSLLQCLGKPAHFNDTIGTVSNLTNILNALDDKSLHSKSEEALKGKTDNEELNSYHGENDSITSVVPSAPEKQTAKEENGDDTTQETDSTTKTFMEKDKVDTEMITVNLLQSCDSSDSGQKTDNQYIPQSVQSIENLKRIDSGLFRVTSLSDSESSLTQSNSITQMHVVSNKDGPPSHENNLEQQRVRLNDDTAVSQGRLPVQEQQNITEGVMVEKDVQGKSGSEAESLRDSDHINKQEKENCSETPDQMTVTEDFEKEPQQVTSFPEESNANIGNRQIESRTISNVMEIRVDQLKDNLPSIYQKRTNLNESETRECIRNDPENKTDSTNPVAHSTESVKEQSLSDHDKSKQEIRRKRKKTDKGESYNSSKKNKKKKKKKEQKTEEMLDSPDVSSQDSETGTEHYVRLKEKDSTLSLSVETDKVSGVESSAAGPISVQSPDLISTSSSVQGSSASPSQLSVHSPGPSSISNDGSTTDDLMWTKETDKIILEKCKSHGVKERTFAKIAKKLGNVTAKQVRKRFSHLYQLIFGSQFSSEDGKGTSSS